jgi:hypothetical protein
MLVKKLHRYDSIYEVRDGEKWWTVSGPGSQEPLIISANMRKVKTTSRTGKRIMKALRDAVSSATTYKLEM